MSIKKSILYSVLLWGLSGAFFSLDAATEKTKKIKPRSVLQKAENLVKKTNKKTKAGKLVKKVVEKPLDVISERLYGQDYEKGTVDAR